MFKGPTFIVVGAAKCGTTSLYNYLQQHPEIYVSTPKEPEFFSLHYEKGIDFYEESFFSGIRNLHKAAGEMSVNYITFPHIAERIYKYNRNMKIVMMFRNPVERAFSAYLMRKYVTAAESLSFEEAIDSSQNCENLEFFLEKGIEIIKEHSRGGISKKDNTIRSYLRQGEYARHIKVYKTYFPHENMHYILLEDLRDNFAETLKQLFIFLGVSEDTQIQDREKQNEFRKANIFTLKKIIGKYNWTNTINRIKVFLPKKIYSYMKRVLIKERTIDKPEMNSETRKRLIEYYKPWNRQLEAILGINLRRWDS